MPVVLGFDLRLLKRFLRLLKRFLRLLRVTAPK